MSVCPGCGLVLPDLAEAIPAPGLEASPECWALYGEVTGPAMSDPELAGWHQLTVDTYAAQHPLAGANPIRTAFALIGLHLALDRGWTGVQVRDAHKRLADGGGPWPVFARPAALDGTRRSIGGVYAAPTASAHVRMLHDWAEEVWAAWRPSAGVQVESLVQGLP
jgi:hypothetical protein